MKPVATGYVKVVPGFAREGVTNFFDNLEDINTSLQNFLQGKPKDARAHLDDLVQVFGPEDVYFEIQHNGVPEQTQVNEAMIRFAKEMGRPLVGTADVHYLRREDYHHHAALLCVQTKSTLAQPKMSFDTNEFYLKDSAEMAAEFAEWPESIATTLEIAERCTFSLKELQYEYPDEVVPPGMTPGEYLAQLSWDGAADRYPRGVPEKVRWPRPPPSRPISCRTVSRSRRARSTIRV